MSESGNILADEREKTEDDARGTKRHPEAEKVHSANDWEHVDLGDEGRKSKFLRLMGANKKQHHGKIVIGEKKTDIARGRSIEDNEKLNAELEDQYRHGLEMKMSGSARRHTGLGFSEPEPPPAASETPSEATDDVAVCTDVEGDTGIPAIAAAEEKSSSLDGEKRRSEARDGSSEAWEVSSSSDNGSKTSGSKKPALVGFVQSSSS